jgi:hypothetical protein
MSYFPALRNGYLTNSLQWAVKYITKADSWTQTDVEIDCETAEACTSGIIQSSSKCTNSTLGVYGTLGLLSTVFEFIGINFAANYLGSWTAFECVQAVSSGFCTWTDKLCHSVWVSAVELIILGYIRRRCSGEVEYTAWSWDYNITVPGNQTRIGCAALCSASTYPDAVPPVLSFS